MKSLEDKVDALTQTVTRVDTTVGIIAEEFKSFRAEMTPVKRKVTQGEGAIMFMALLGTISGIVMAVIEIVRWKH